MAWPTLPTQSANSFLDHFAGSSLDATKWGTIVQNGTITVADSYADFNCAASQAAAIYALNKLDKTKSQLWTCAVNHVPSSGPSNIFYVVNSATAPVSNSYATFNGNVRALVSLSMSPAPAGVKLQYYDGSQTLNYWTGSTWSTTGTQAVQPIAAADYYVIGFEIDGINSQFRFHLWHQSYTTAGTYTWAQGLRLFAQTAWVPWSSVGTSADLWLVLGNPYNSNGAAIEQRVEWVRYSEAPAGNGVIDWWGAGGGPTASTGILHAYSYDGWAFVEQDLSTIAVNTGAAYDSGGMNQPWVVTDGTTDYMFYRAIGGTPASSICLATAAHVANGPQNGPWTKYASNPIYLPQAGEDLSTFPWVMLDQSESDPNKRWKMLSSNHNTSTGHWYTRLVTAPAATGPWTDQGIVLNVGATGDPDQTAARDPVVVRYGGQWEMWYEAWDANGYTTIMRATSPDLATWTKDGAGARISWQAAGDTTLAALFSGNTVQVASTAGFVQDGYVWISPAVNTNTYLTSRVRKVIDATHLELYHGVTTDNTWTLANCRIAQVDSTRHFSPRVLIWDGSQWRFILNYWQPFQDYENANKIIEQTGGFATQPGPAPTSSPFAIQMQAYPSPTRGPSDTRDSQTLENATFINAAFTGDGGVALPLGTRSLLGVGR